MISDPVVSTGGGTYSGGIRVSEPWVRLIADNFITQSDWLANNPLLGSPVDGTLNTNYAYIHNKPTKLTDFINDLPFSVEIDELRTSLQDISSGKNINIHLLDPLP